MFLFTVKIKSSLLSSPRKIHSWIVHGRDLTHKLNRNRWALDRNGRESMWHSGNVMHNISCRSSNKYLPALDDLLLFTDAPIFSSSLPFESIDVFGEEFSSPSAIAVFRAFRVYLCIPCDTSTYHFMYFHTFQQSARALLCEIKFAFNAGREGGSRFPEESLSFPCNHSTRLEAYSLPPSSIYPTGVEIRSTISNFSPLSKVFTLSLSLSWNGSETW